jgi:hypothetical protein
MARRTNKPGGERKPPAERKSRSVTIRVLEGFKARIEAEASKSGRSVSEEIAYRVGLSYLIREPVETATEVARILGDETDKTIEAAMHRRGWDKRIDPRYGGPVFTKPGQAPLPKSRFIGTAEANEEPRPVATVTPAVEDTLSRIVEAAVAKALARAKLTIGEDQ